MIYITGDVHGYFGRVRRFSSHIQTSKDDVLIILGDASINYFEDKADLKLKHRLKQTPLTLFCIHGNHEKRPETIDSYREVEFMGARAYQEEAFPNIYFAKDGEVYTINGCKTLVIGGAYSVDKKWRLDASRKWWPDEQPTDEIKQRVEAALAQHAGTIDVVLSHTSPMNARPTEAFLPVIDQSEVDSSTELWLQSIADTLNFKRWYFGHFHINKRFDPYRCLFKDVEVFMEDTIVYATEDDENVLKQMK
ncbi:MAG: metallophosphoesterase [Coriobacteriia bacterium]|nr:metallophosphoesterase [Coriobacteriia bacterium]